MSSLLVKRPFLLAGIVGVLALAVGAVVNRPIAGVQFTCPEGFTRPILAFELMESNAEFVAFFGQDTPDRPVKIEKMTKALHRDNYFVPLYTLFMGLFALTIARQRRRWFDWALVAVALLVGVLDLFENYKQLYLVSTLTTRGAVASEQDFQQLLWFAWPKWILLGVYFLALRRSFAGDNFFGRILALAALVALPLSLIACIMNWNQGAEWYVLMMLFGMFPLTLVYCFTYRAPETAKTLPSDKPSASPVSE